MTELQSQYDTLMKNLEIVKKQAEKLALALEPENTGGARFNELFIAGNPQEKARGAATAIGKAAEDIRASVGSQLEKYDLIRDYEALCGQRERLCSPTLQLIALLKKTGARGTEGISSALRAGDAAAELKAYSDKVASLSRRTVNPGAFKASFSLKKKPAQQPAKQASESTDRYAFVQPGKTVTFGSYPQTAAGTDKTPIDWLVLAREGNKALLISKYGLDTKPYCKEFVGTPWETCSLRKWLNGEFLTTAFSASNRMMIEEATVPADMNPKYNTNPGNATKDKVFLLSIPEAEKYFASDEARKCVPTEYAVAQDAFTGDDYAVGGKATCWWWLRSPGSRSYDAASVSRGGSVSAYGSCVNYEGACVRPVVALRLS